ncbi:MAG: hypothetical protein OXI91_14100 [Chloroflexota bacterium]|nr:hypothetical protein [Chloroflexota bacterium]
MNEDNDPSNAGAAPLATREELSVFSQIPATTLRPRLAKLAGLGLVATTCSTCSDPAR